MKLEKLSAGMKLKNYKALCECLDEPVKAGNSKNAQLKEFSRYFAYRREGNAYIVEEIYDVPKPIDDKRQRYVQLIEPVLLNYLANSETEMGVTWTRWYKQIGFVHEHFYDEWYREEVRDVWWANSYTLFFMTNMVSRKNREVLTSALSNMKKRGLITYEEKWFIVKRDGSGHEAEEGEERVVMRRIRHVLDEMGCENLQQVFLSPKRYEMYQKKFHDIINDGFWRNAYKSLRIEPVGTAYERYKDIDVEPLKKKLNSELCKVIRKTAQDVWEKEDDLEWWTDDEADGTQEKKRFSLPDRFTWDVDYFVDQLMCL